MELALMTIGLVHAHAELPDFKCLLMWSFVIVSESDASYVILANYYL